MLSGVWICSGKVNWVDPCACDRALMEKDVAVPPETFRKHVDACLTHVNRALKQMSRLFLVEDLVDSLKVSGTPADLNVYSSPIHSGYFKECNVFSIHHVYRDIQVPKITRSNKELLSPL